MKRAVVGLLAVVLMAGCSGSALPGPIQPDEAGLAKVDLARLVTTPADGQAAAAAANSFGLALYALAAADDPSTNIVLSPTSIALALAMARAGARGETAAEMDRVLRGFGSDEHAAWVAALDAALTSRSGTFRDLNGDDQDVTLRIANAPFAQAGFELVPAYLDALAQRFGAGLRLVDYRTAAEEARQVINAWVADQTEDRIEELLAAGTLDELTRLVLVNAIYLKAPWQTPFAEGMTSDGPFTRADGSAVQVPLMRGGLDVPYATGAGWRAVELPYVGDELAMLVIVPDDLEAFEAAFDEPVLASIVASLENRHVRLGLPKFGIESRLELADLLGALGMPTAFTANADFAGITTEDRLLIDRVIHQANIDVDEAGTEAAAATAIVMRATGMPVDDVELTVDKPFLFALRDTVTGAVVFLGRIADPSDGR
jgi:serpin B